MESVASERLSWADHGWLRMEAPENPMVITALVTFAEPFPPAALESLVRERLLPNARFRQRLAPATFLRGARWEEDPHLDLGGHLHHVALPHPGDDHELAGLVGDLMSTPLDPRRPLWQMHVVDGYAGGSALVVRLHHSIADGVALVGLLRSVAGAPPEAPRPGRPHALETHGVLAKAGRAAAAAGRLLLLPSDARTSLKGDLGTTKRAAVSPALKLATLKAAAGRHDAKVNDVFATLVAGGLRRYLCGRGQLASHLEVRAVVPVDLRREAQGPAGLALGNHFGLAFLGLPLWIEAPEQRLREIARRTRAFKRSAEPAVTFAILEAMALAAQPVDDLVISVFQAKATLVLTSVAGPSAPVSLADHPVRSMAFWAPQAGRLGLGVSILSYAGEARIGVAADAKLVAQPDEIVAGVDDELYSLLS